MNDRQPVLGPHLAGYRYEELIGRGGMGEVYRATTFAWTGRWR